MNTNPFISGMDLTTEPPRSPKAQVGGFYILGRTIDKCRASLFGQIGEYHFDCPLDKSLFVWKGIVGTDFKKYVAEGHSDDEIADWVRSHGTPRNTDEINVWNDQVFNNDYSDNPENREWLLGELKRLDADKDATLFDYLEADDKASFKK